LAPDEMTRHPRPRLLLVVHSAKPAGAQLVALGQAEALAHDHELLIAVGAGPLRERFGRVGRLVRGPTRLPVWGASRARWGLEIARAVPDAVRLAVIARRYRVSAILTNSIVLVAPVLAARLARLPVIVYVQEAPKSAAARRLFRFHGAFADTVVAISRATADALGTPRARVLLSPVGIPVPPRPERGPRDPVAPLRTVVVGTIDRHKRQDVAVSALAALRRQGVEATLELVGPQPDGVYRAEVEALADRLGLGDRVDMPGASEDVAGRLQRADVLLVPTGEVTPLVIMEAMAHGTPVVAAAMGGIPEVVVDGDSGLLVPPGDAQAMATALTRIAAEPELATRLADGGRARVEARFDQARSNARLREELAHLVGAPCERTAAAAAPVGRRS
jgi:glycosyltransferase involved in cell wall biosynthesis